MVGFCAVDVDGGEPVSVGDDVPSPDFGTLAISRAGEADGSAEGLAAADAAGGITTTGADFETDEIGDTAGRGRMASEMA